MFILHTMLYRSHCKSPLPNLPWSWTLRAETFLNQTANLMSVDWSLDVLTHKQHSWESGHSFIFFPKNEQPGAMLQALPTRTSSLHQCPLIVAQKGVVVLELTHFGKFLYTVWTRLETRDPYECNKKSGPDAIPRALNIAAVLFILGSFVWMFRQGLIIAQAYLQLTM